MQVTYYYFSNPAQERAISELVEKWRWVLPPWVQTLGVFLVNLEESTVAQISVRPEYLRAIVEVSPRFFDEVPARMEEQFVHELCHAQYGELIKWAETLLKDLVDGKLLSVLQEELRVRNERVTEALCLLLMRRPCAREPIHPSLAGGAVDSGASF